MPSFFWFTSFYFLIYSCISATMQINCILTMDITLVESVGGCNTESFIVVVLGIVACGLNHFSLMLKYLP